MAKKRAGEKKVPREKRAERQQPAAKKTQVRAKQTVPDAAGGRREKLIIVGIGASAGGLEAIESFFQQMNPESGMAFVLVQHLDPTHRSILSELVGRFSKMSVQEVSQSQQVEPNHVYVIPPNRDLAILNNRLQLLDPSGPRHLRLSIDYFFRSLAQEARESAVGIVLSGTGTDGTLGIRAIKGEGGLVLVQDPASAAYDGMPRSAIATGLADAVLQPAEMARQLLAYARNTTFPHTVPATVPQEAKDDRERLFVLLRSQTGHDFSLYKEATISRRIQRRMTINDISNEADFIKLLQQSPTEVDALWKEFLIRVTQFFRDPEVFEELGRRVIPELLQTKGADQEIRIWVPACSTGEEVYSIAMLIYENLERLGQVRDVQIFATDIDQTALEIARAGVYPESVISDVSKERLSRFFNKSKNTYVVGKDLRRMLVFSSHDVIKDPPFSRIDLVSCRNLLIYMKSELQARVLGLFHYALNENGHLLLGSSETTSAASELFVENNRKLHLYQQRPRASSGYPRLPYSGFFQSMGLGGMVKGTKNKASAPSLRELTESALLDLYAPTCVVVDEAGNMLYVHGQTGRFLEATTGEANLNITRLARKELSIHMSAALRESNASQAEVCYRSLSMEDHGENLVVDMRVRPLPGWASQKRSFLVLFEEASTKSSATEPAGVLATNGALVERATMLEQELASTREVLQTANEELQTSNEELSSTVEELQSTNEELLTSQEELRSVNEELLTVNAELEGKLDQLAEANADKENILTSTEVGTIFLDLEQRIKWFSSTVCDVIYLIESDIGRPLAHISHRLQGVDLPELVEQVMDNLEHVDLEVCDDEGRWYDLRITLYRTEMNAIAGTVVTVSDISEVKRAKQYQLFHRLLESSPDATVIADAAGDIYMANRQAEALFGFKADELLGKPVELLLPARFQEKHRRHRNQFLQTPRVRDMAFGTALSCRRKDGSEFFGQISLSPIDVEGGMLVYAAIRDISVQVANEGKLKRIAGIYGSMKLLDKLERNPQRHGANQLQRLCREMVQEVGYKQCWIGRRAGRGSADFDVVASTGLPRSAQPQLETLLRKGLRGNKPSVIRGGMESGEYRDLHPIAAAWGFNAVALLPLVNRKRVVGTLCLHARDAEAFDAMELAPLLALGKRLAYCFSEAVRTGSSEAGSE
ncbi:MAG: PAS domain S-box protein [Gammaproteobacteria bacterium]|nr:PAS domain S-box protein [Gammaproteobacteria bacterium]